MHVYTICKYLGINTPAIHPFLQATTDASVKTGPLPSLDSAGVRNLDSFVITAAAQILTIIIRLIWPHISVLEELSFCCRLLLRRGDRIIPLQSGQLHITRLVSMRKESREQPGEEWAYHRHGGAYDAKVNFDVAEYH